MFGLFGSKRKSKGADENPLKSQRFNDGIIIITQDNQARSLRIEAANMNALNMLGYNQEDILDQDLRDFVTNRIVDELNEYLEYKSLGNDLHDVLGRVRRFNMKKKNGENLPLRIRVVRSLSTLDSPRFQVVLNDDTLIQNIEENREQYRMSLRGDEIFDKRTGLLSRESIIKDLELIAFYADKRDIKSSAVHVTIKSEIKDEDKIREIASLLNKNKRDHDISGTLSENEFLLILTETPQDKVMVPVARLRQSLTEKAIDFDIKLEPINSDTKIESLV